MITIPEGFGLITPQETPKIDEAIGGLMFIASSLDKFAGFNLISRIDINSPRVNLGRVTDLSALGRMTNQTNLAVIAAIYSLQDRNNTVFWTNPAEPIDGFNLFTQNLIIMRKLHRSRENVNSLTSTASMSFTLDNRTFRVRRLQNKINNIPQGDSVEVSMSQTNQATDRIDFIIDSHLDKITNIVLANGTDESIRLISTAMQEFSGKINP